MQSTRPVLVAAIFLGAFGVPDAGAGKAEVAAKAGAAVKAGQKALQSGQLPAGAAELKSKAVSALSTLPANAAKALQGGKGAASFTPEQLQQIQSQAGQVFTSLTADPRASAAAAQAGVTTQKLDALKTQTAAAVAGFKGPDGKPSVESAGQQAREFMKSEPVTDLKTQANQAAANLSANPQVNSAARQVGREVRETAAQAGLELPGKRPALNAHNAEAFKERAAQAAANGDVAAGAAAFQTNAQKALAKFCKKYEGKTAVPARCRKPKAPTEQ